MDFINKNNGVRNITLLDKVIVSLLILLSLGAVVALLLRIFTGFDYPKLTNIATLPVFSMVLYLNLRIYDPKSLPKALRSFLIASTSIALVMNLIALLFFN